MTIATTVAALQALHATVSGVTSAPTTMPASVNTADMPMVLTRPGPGTWTLEAVGLRRQDREYVVGIFVAPVGQNTVDGAIDLALPIIQGIGEAYIGDPTLGGAVRHIALDFTDTGVDAALTMGGITYRGCEFRIRITEKW